MPTFTGGTWANATSITFPPAGTVLINSSAGLFPTEGAAAASAIVWSTSALNLSGVGTTPVSTPVSSLFGFGSGRWIFDLVTLNRTGSGNSTALQGQGVLRDTTNEYENTGAAFTFSGTNPSASTFTNYSVSFAAGGPPPAVVPVPAALPLLAAGLAAFGAFARRRRA